MLDYFFLLVAKNRSSVAILACMPYFLFRSTGKTIAARISANRLKLAIDRIDLVGVVNKYIGETEKNLCRVFDAAEQSGAILFFDEADVLFGKRSEVKDSRDSCADIEINDLFQRTENDQGVAILATILKCLIDQTFSENYPRQDGSLGQARVNKYLRKP